MANALNENTLTQVLDWTYDKAINGLAGLDSAGDMANNYLKGTGSLVDNVNALIRMQNTKAAASGFLSGLGGAVLMPVTIPANVTSVLYVQIRMIAAIAIMGEHDIKDDRVKSLVLACLAGDVAKEILKDMGIAFGSKMATNALNSLSAKTIIAINQKISFKLATNFGEKGVVNLGKAVPLVGGLIGGTVDLVATNFIGNVARNTFVGAG